jgi:hypothetical protein
MDGFIGPINGNLLLTTGGIQVPPVGGVYLWRRTARRDPEALRDAAGFAEWLERSISIPSARFSDFEGRAPVGAGRLTVRPGYVRFGYLEIGGGALSSVRSELLAQIAQNQEQRARLASLLRRAGDNFGPVMYVGESGSLRARAIAHASGETPLLARLGELGATLDELDFWCISLPDMSQEGRQLVEQTLTHFLGSPLVMRAG